LASMGAGSKDLASSVMGWILGGLGAVCLGSRFDGFVH
jgi:hypothetical protein